MIDTFDQFDDHVDATLKGVNCETPYCALALSGEAGEFANLVKKRIRDHEGHFDSGSLEQALLELGDVLWYVSAAAKTLGYGLGEIANMNQQKLQRRRTTG